MEMRLCCVLVMKSLTTKNDGCSLCDKAIKLQINKYYCPLNFRVQQKN